MRASHSPALLFSTAAFFGRPLDESFGLIAEAGFSGAEVMVTKDPASQDPRRIRDLAREHGLTVGAIHAPCLLVTRRVWGTDPVRKVYRAVEAAETAEVPLVVVHPPFRWQPAYRRWLIERAPSLAERTGIDIAVENMFPLHLGERRSLAFHSGQDLDELDPYGSLVLDTSHASAARHDPIQVRRLFGERLRHVHLSDNAGKGWDSHLPLGQGVLDIDGIVEDLSMSGFTGAMSLEVDLRRTDEGAGVRDLMVRMRERCERLLALPAA